MTGTRPGDAAPRQEPDVVPSARVAWLAGTSLVVGALGLSCAAALLAGTTGAIRPEPRPVPGPRPAPGGTSHVLEGSIFSLRPGLDLRDAQRHELERWGWVDRQRGIAEIPVERAIDLVVAAGAARRGTP
jgi:hypothetical protein